MISKTSTLFDKNKNKKPFSIFVNGKKKLVKIRLQKSKFCLLTFQKTTNIRDKRIAIKNGIRLIGHYYH